MREVALNLHSFRMSMGGLIGDTPDEDGHTEGGKVNARKKEWT